MTYSEKFLVTNGIQALLALEEIWGIYQKIQQLVNEESGLNYLQVYIHEDTEEKIFFIDQLNTEMIESGSFATGDNHCTLLLASEYQNDYGI